MIYIKGTGFNFNFSSPRTKALAGASDELSVVNDKAAGRQKELAGTTVNALTKVHPQQGRCVTTNASDKEATHGIEYDYQY